MLKTGLPARFSVRLRFLRILLLLAGIVFGLVSAFAWPVVSAQMQSLDTPTPHATLTPESPVPNRLSPVPSSPTPFPPTPTVTASPTATPVLSSELLVISMREGGYHRLFAYHPQYLPFTRLTTGAWDDITPALSPNGTRLAFASNRDGPWDLYILDLSSGEVTRLTNTPDYDAAPSWSPDGQWLAYETYTAGEGGANLEIFIRPVQEGQEPVRLTQGSSADRQPAWSPHGRQIAFVSNRSGEDEIWLADLDQVENRFRNLSRNNAALEAHPAWSPDGSRLSWTAATAGGIQSLFILDAAHLDAAHLDAAHRDAAHWDAAQAESSPRLVGSGGRPAWSPDGNTLYTSIDTPNQAYLTGYAVAAAELVLPNIALSSQLSGLDAGKASLGDRLPGPLSQAAMLTPAPLWIPSLAAGGGAPAGRMRIVPLAEVEAPEPYLQDLVDEAFQALRLRLAAETGWDFLASLENAFVPLTTPLEPGMGESWLYTGRAFAFNPAPLGAGWLVVLREDYGAQTCWRVYLKTRFQDGSQGQPLPGLPWNFSARYAGSPRDYEQGGALAEAIPEGYWLDFTELAAAYGWERLPALNAWRASYPAARFNEFIFTGRLDWRSAMLEIYPAEALNTPTPVPPPTLTPTATRWPTRTPVPTRTPYPTRTPSAPSGALPAPTPTLWTASP